MNVYLLFENTRWDEQGSGSYYERALLGIYTTRELAEQIRDRHKPNDHADSTTWDIEDHPVLTEERVL